MVVPGKVFKIKVLRRLKNAIFRAVFANIVFDKSQPYRSSQFTESM